MSDQDFSKQLQNLKNRLFTQVKTYGHCYLLLDPALGPVLEDDIQAADIAEEDQATILDPLLALEPEKALILLRLTTRNIELLDACVALALTSNTDMSDPQRGVCAWIFSPQPISKLAVHLKHWLNVAIPAQKRIFFRYYDPRVATHLPRILSATQISEWLKGIEEWSWVDRDGQWQTIKPVEPIENKALYLPQLDELQWAALQRVETINLCLRTLQSIEAVSPPPTQDYRVDDWVSAAQTKGYTAQEDAIAYALHAWLVHPQFMEHSAVQHALIESSKNNGGLCQALAQFEQADLDRIKNDLIKNNPGNSQESPTWATH